MLPLASGFIPINLMLPKLAWTLALGGTPPHSCRHTTSAELSRLLTPVCHFVSVEALLPSMFQVTISMIGHRQSARGSEATFSAATMPDSSAARCSAVMDA